MRAPQSRTEGRHSERVADRGAAGPAGGHPGPAGEAQRHRRRPDRRAAPGLRRAGSPPAPAVAHRRRGGHLRRWRRHRPAPRTGPHGRPRRDQLGRLRPHPGAADADRGRRRRPGVGRWRGAGVRLRSAGVHGAGGLRPAGGAVGHPGRRRRDPPAARVDRRGSGQGAALHRPAGGRRRGAADRPGEPGGGRARRAADGGARAAGRDRPGFTAGGAADQAGGGRAGRRAPACSTWSARRCSSRTTRSTAG